MLADAIAIIGSIFQIIGIPLGAAAGIFLGGVFIGKFIKAGMGSDDE